MSDESAQKPLLTADNPIAMGEKLKELFKAGMTEDQKAQLLEEVPAILDRQEKALTEKRATAPESDVKAIDEQLGAITQVRGLIKKLSPEEEQERKAQPQAEQQQVDPWMQIITLLIQALLGINPQQQQQEREQAERDAPPASNVQPSTAEPTPSAPAAPAAPTASKAPEREAANDAADLSDDQLRARMVTGGVLTGLYNTKEALNTKESFDGVVRFSTGEGDYKAYKNIKDSLTKDNISQIEITTKDANGKDQVAYYKKIAEEGTDVKDKGGKTGFKAVAWVQTDKDGKPLLDSKGNADVVVGFPGYGGNPLEFKRSPQTESMYAIGAGKLYPQTAEVPAFLDKVKQNLEKEGVKSYDAQVVGHSMGGNNALVASAALKAQGTKVDSTTFIEPVGMSGNARLMKEALAADPKNLTPEQQALRDAMPKGATPESIDVAANSAVSVRTLDRSKAKQPVSNSALLEVNRDGEPLAVTENRNLTTSGVSLSGALSMFAGGQKGGRGGPIDRDNQPVGQEYYIDVTGQKNKAGGLAASTDPTHALGNNVSAANDNAPVLEREKAMALIEVRGNDGVQPVKKAEKPELDKGAEDAKDESKSVSRKTSAADSPFKLNFNMIASNLGLKLPDNLYDATTKGSHGLSDEVKRATNPSLGKGSVA